MPFDFEKKAKALLARIGLKKIEDKWRTVADEFIDIHGAAIELAVQTVARNKLRGDDIISVTSSASEFNKLLDKIMRDIRTTGQSNGGIV